MCTSIATQGHDINVVVDDTDVLVLLMHHWKQNMAGFYVFTAADLVRQAGPIVTSHLLFLGQGKAVS